jgi:hypothetical protein
VGKEYGSDDVTVTLRKPTQSRNTRDAALMHAVLQALEDIGQTFTATLRLEPVLDRIIDEAVSLADGDAGSVLLVT